MTRALLLFLLALPLCAVAAEPAELIARLGSEEFRAREDAQRALRALLLGPSSDRVMPLILEGYKDESADPEVRVRLLQLVRVAVERHHFEERNGFIGINIGNAAFFENQQIVRAVQVMHVVPGLQGDEAGLQPGDQILEIDGVPFKEVDATGDFMRRIGFSKPGTTVKLTLKRGNERVRLPVDLMKRPAEMGPGLYDRDKDLRQFFDAWIDENAPGT